MQPDESGTLRAEQPLPSQPWFIAHQGRRVTDCQLSVTLCREAAPSLPFIIPFITYSLFPHSLTFLPSHCPCSRFVNNEPKEHYGNMKRPGNQQPQGQMLAPRKSVHTYGPRFHPLKWGDSICPNCHISLFLWDGME